MSSLLGDAEAVGNEIKRKRVALVETNRAISNLLDLAENFGAGAAAQRLKERETARAILETEIKLLQERTENLDVTISPEAMQEIMTAWRGEFDDLVKVGDVAALRSFLTRFVSKIEIGYDFEAQKHEIVIHRVWSVSGFSSSQTAGSAAYDLPVNTMMLTRREQKSPPIKAGFFVFDVLSVPIDLIHLDRHNNSPAAVSAVPPAKT